jgi:hypothetical protein
MPEATMMTKMPMLMASSAIVAIGGLGLTIGWASKPGFSTDKGSG